MASRRGKSEGSIYQRGDRRWVAEIDCGFVDGRRVRKSMYGKSRQAVADRLKVELGKQSVGTFVKTDDRMSIDRFLDAWLLGVSVRPKTRRQYEQVVRLYLKPGLGTVRLAQVTPDHVRALVRGLEARGLSARTATLSRDVLRIALSQAVSDGLLGRNVAGLVRRPKPTRSQARTLSPDEARALLDALSGHRLEAVVTCGVSLGLRLGEVLGLQWTDVDIPAGRLTVRHALHTLGKERTLALPKSRESRRTLALPAVLVRALDVHRRAQAERRLAAGAEWQRSDFVFTTRTGRPLDGTLVTRDLRALLAKTWRDGRPECPHARERDAECLDCGARRLQVVSFHGLRHSCASLLLASGVPVREVSELLGHSDVRLTLQTYAHVLEENRGRVASAMDRVLGTADSQADSLTDSQRTGLGRILVDGSKSK